MSKKPEPADGTIAVNRKAKFDYYIEAHYEGGLALQGWEVKALRAKKGNLTDSYVLLKDGEAYLFGAQITPDFDDVEFGFLSEEYFRHRGVSSFSEK